MRKQVTFVEKQALPRHVSIPLAATRSAGSSLDCRSRPHENIHGEQSMARTPRALHFKPPPRQTCENQLMKTIHIPKSMMAAPFLQHPSLTAGQKRYLYSIANVYSTDHVRRQMKQRRLARPGGDGRGIDSRDSAKAESGKLVLPKIPMRGRNTASNDKGYRKE
ncbi:protein FAM216A-like [Denticeps clupeoides]|uniref:Uncharacterized protein n=1 Tax=Denticeps clupeoides TaxID=299321 RepID=A0AAY4D398_9TELE|nr:protein FAM216A [Denticeps clupeoides]